MSITQKRIDEADKMNASSARKEPIGEFDRICLDLRKEIQWRTQVSIVVPDGYVDRYIFWHPREPRHFELDRKGFFCTSGSYIQLTPEELLAIAGAAISIKQTQHE